MDETQDVLHRLNQLEGEVLVTAAAYTVRERDDIIVCNTTSNAITITLPRATNGKRLTLLRSAGGNNVTVSPVGSDTINGAASATISASYAPLVLKASAVLSSWVSA